MKPDRFTHAVRLSWRVRAQPGVPGADSLFVIDLPGERAGRAFQSADLIGAHFEPVKTEGGHAVEHVSGTGVVVPAGSAPAHVVITPDQVLYDRLVEWGLQDWSPGIFSGFRPRP